MNATKTTKRKYCNYDKNDRNDDLMKNRWKRKLILIRLCIWMCDISIFIYTNENSSSELLYDFFKITYRGFGGSLASNVPSFLPRSFDSSASPTKSKQTIFLTNPNILLISRWATHCQYPNFQLDPMDWQLADDDC